MGTFALWCAIALMSVFIIGLAKEVDDLRDLIEEMEKAEKYHDQLVDDINLRHQMTTIEGRINLLEGWHEFDQKNIDELRRGLNWVIENERTDSGTDTEV